MSGESRKTNGEPRHDYRAGLNELSLGPTYWLTVGDKRVGMRLPDGTVVCWFCFEWIRDTNPDLVAKNSWFIDEIILKDEREWRRHHYSEHKERTKALILREQRRLMRKEMK
jgi:hypothetical protein